MASVNSITLNGGSVSPFAGRVITVQGTQELHLLGTNLTSRDVQLVHDGVTYTPLQSTQEDFFFLLGSNGSNVITVNGRWLCTIVVEGVVMPDGVPFSGRLSIKSNSSLDRSASSEIATLNVAAGECINLAGMVSDSAIYIRFASSIGGEGSDPSAVGYVLHNASVVNAGLNGGLYVIIATVNDTSLPMYLTYEGFVVAVTNY